MGDTLLLTYAVDGGDLTMAGEASAQMKMTLRRLGFPPEIIRRASICMYEGEINMVIHANGGQVTVEISPEEIVLTLADQGPGIADVEKAMEEGYTTAGTIARDLGFGAGMGLPNMKKYADTLSIDSTPGVGTTVRMTIRLS